MTDGRDVAGHNKCDDRPTVTNSGRGHRAHDRQAGFHPDG